MATTTFTPSMLRGAGTRGIPEIPAGSTFSPSDISGLIAWYKPGVGLTIDGSGFISKWEDQSGNGNDLTQTSATFQPKLTDGTSGRVGVNGYNAVDFDTNSNGNARLDCVLGSTLDQPYTMCGVWSKSEVYSGYGRPIIEWDGSSLDYNKLSWTTRDITNGYSIKGGTTVQLGGSGGSTLLPLNPTYSRVVFIMNGASSYAYLNMVDWMKNGAPQNVGSNSIDGFRLGHGYANEQLAEFIVYDSSLSSANQTSIDNYFKTKYNL